MEYDPQWYKAWHGYALTHYQCITHYENSAENSQKQIQGHLQPAISGFFRSISLGTTHDLQDLLRLLNLMFKYGNIGDVEDILMDGFGRTSPDTWLKVSGCRVSI